TYCVYISTMLQRSVVHNVLKSLNRLMATRSMLVESTSHIQTAKPFKDIPGPRGVYLWPVIGAFLHFKPFTQFTTESNHTLIAELLTKYGPLIKLRFGRLMVIVSDPKDIETVYRNEGKYPMTASFDIEEMIVRRTSSPVKSITLAQGEDWHKLRAPINKLLMKVDSATHYLEPHNQVANKFVDILATQNLKPQELQTLFARYAAEGAGLVVFNTRLGFLEGQLSEELSDFLDATKTLFSILQDVILGKSVGHRWYKSKTYQDYARALGIIGGSCAVHSLKAHQVLEERKRAGTLTDEEPNLLLSLLKEENLQRADVDTMLISLYTAGAESTAKILETLFYNLAKNPETQEKLRQEIFRKLNTRDHVTATDLANLSYLKACLKESFRLCPPVCNTMVRLLPIDVCLSGYNVPARTPIMIYPNAKCISGFQDPLTYMPERWLQNNGLAKHDPLAKIAVLPFGLGPRNCAGQRIAVQEIYLATIKVLQKMRIELHPESSDVEFVYRIFLQPKVPIHFKFTALQKC
ncbi:cytochrome P450 12e1, mitochondrial, partial [Biomphalaria glabrata]